jgi:hypothetical protein
MKKLNLVLITIMVAVFATTVAQATLISSGVTETEFNDLLVSTGNIWNVKFRPGTNDLGDNEIQIGDYDSFDTTTGDAAWLFPNGSNGTNPFTVTVSGGSSVSASLNGKGSGVFGISDSYNEIWIGIFMDTGIGADVLSTSNMQFEGNLTPNLGPVSSPNFQGLKFHDTTQLVNMADMTLDGDFVANLVGEASFDGFNIIVMGTENAAIIPEPNTFVLLLIGVTTGLIVYKRRW